MSTECPKCGLEHDQVDVLRWLWLLRDTKPKPPGVQLGVLVMLAARMDGTTGCGWTTDPDLAELAGNVDRHAVQRATRWGRDRLLLHRVSKGYRITDERGQKSHWLLTDPATQRLLTDPALQRRISAALAPEPTEHPRDHGSEPTERPRDHGSAEPTEHPRRANGTFRPDPTEHQCATKANPEKLVQEAKPTPHRPVVNSSLEGVAREGQGDDDDSETRSTPEPGPRRGSCGVCGGTRYRVGDDGLLPVHGPRRARCKGSRQPPAEAEDPRRAPARGGAAMTASNPRSDDARKAAR